MQARTTDALLEKQSCSSNASTALTDELVGLHAAMKLAGCTVMSPPACMQPLAEQLACSHAQDAPHGSEQDAEGGPSSVQKRRLDRAEIHCSRMKKERDAAAEALQQHKASAQAAQAKLERELNSAAEACQQLEADLEGREGQVRALQQAVGDLETESLQLMSQCEEKDRK